MILRGTLPEPQGHLLAAHVHAQGDEKRLTTPVDRVQEQRERRALRQGPLLEGLEILGRQRHHLLGHGRRRHAESSRRIEDGLGVFLRRDASQDFLQQFFREVPGGVQPRIGLQRDLSLHHVSESGARHLDLLVADVGRARLVGPFLQRGMGRVVVGTRQLFPLDQHDALGHQASHLQHHRVQRLFA